MSRELELLSGLLDIYIEADPDEGIRMACDICRDQGRERIVKQLGHQLTLKQIVEAMTGHVIEHPVVSKENEA